MSSTWYIIPAREGSKGFPGKNRILFDHTAKTIPEYVKDQVIVTSNDDEILKQAKEYGLKFFKRDEVTSSDEASTKDFMMDVLKTCEFIEVDDTLVLLYLTYPERTWDDVEAGLLFFEENQAKSMLCRMEALTHPYLTMWDTEGSNMWAPVVIHNACRRQEYPKVFEMSHFLWIGKAGEVKGLSRNLHNSKTVFMPIERPINVDLESDMDNVTTR